MPPKPGTHWKILLPVFLLVCGWLTCASAADSGSDWFSRVWQVDDGLPAANVTGIAQTHDGYLWLATQSGLARFDGVKFQVMPIPGGHPQPIIHVMLCDHAENLWLAVSGAIIRYDTSTGTARMFTISSGLPDAVALQIIETPDHGIWICYSDGSVCRITPDNHIIPITTADGLTDDGVCSLTLDSHDVLWFAKGFQYGFLNGGRFQNVGTLNDRNAHILGTRKGGLWFCTSSQVLESESNSAPVVVANFGDDTKRVRPSVLFEDFSGRLWIGTVSEGLFQLNSTNLFKIEISQNRIRAIIRDREGSIWVGTDGGGLNRLQRKVVELVGRDEGLPFETVRSMAEDSSGDLWVITQDGALTKLPPNDWSNGQPIPNWPGGLAHCVLMDKEGTMWIGTYRRGLFCWRDGKFTRFDTQNGLGGMAIRSLMVDRHDDLWIGIDTEPLVQRLHDGRFQDFKLPANCRSVRAMAEDSDGNIWLGTLDGRLFRVDGDKLSEVESSANEPLHPIRCMTTTPDGSVWIGYSINGICRLKDGQISHIGTDDGLYDGNVCALMPDDAGRMWVASDLGIFYVTLAQLNSVADNPTNRVRSIFYGRDAGLPSLQAYYGYQPGVIVTKSGEILFPTHSGIAVVHPDRVRVNPQPPDVLIQNVMVDGKELAWSTNEVVKLPPDHRRIEIAFTAPSFIAPEQVTFRYRLSGWDEDWSDVERGRSAVFSRLPPGDYKFQVTACNSSGVWNEQGTSLAFIVMPFFWQGWIFRTVAVLLFLAVIVLLVRHLMLRRVRLLLKRVEQEAILQEERTRIAQDMHDELGARFTQISLLGELSRNAIGEPDKAHDYLGQISRVASIGVKSLDEIVWAVNPRNDTLPDLLDYTGQYARDFLAAAGIECRLDFPDPLPGGTVSGDIRHGLFLIIKETLNNVVKHAQAKRVKIIFELTKPEMCWRIEDDGVGFDQAPDNALADGLRNIRQRAAALGGEAEIESQTGKGTRVTVRIPLK